MLANASLVCGGLEPVEDAGGGHSVFAKTFLDSLLANTGVVDMRQIFSSMRLWCARVGSMRN